MNAAHTKRSARHVMRVIEVVCALVLTGGMLSNRDLRALIWALSRALTHTVMALPPLITVDGAGTMRSAGIMVFALAAMIAPPLRYFAHAPRRRWLWLPLWLALLAFLTSVAPLGIALPQKWITMLIAAIVGWSAAVRRRLGWMAFVPMLVAGHPTMTTHGGVLLSDLIWSTERLARRCAHNDGMRPGNFSIDQASPHYYSATPVGQDTLVLTRERGSAYRLRRGADGRFSFDGNLEIYGNLWQGTIGEGRLFYTHSGSGLVSVRLADLDGRGQAVGRQIPALPGTSRELDLLDAVYEPTTRSVFLTELVRGGLWEASLTDDSMRHYALNAFYLQAVRRDPDAMLVGISTTELLVFDPRTKQVTERSPAALGAGGLDVCQVDGAAIVADYAGRLRLFARTSSGPYRFERGVSLSSPRRVAFSPDCAWIAVTSGDDETAYVLRRSDLSIWRTFHMGPGLRDLVYTRPREVAIVDACTVNVVPGGEP